MRILIVDDGDSNRRLLTRLLGRLGHSSDAVSSGEEALERLAASAYELVLLDLQMPGMDGFETARRIRAEHPGGIRLWATTGFSQDEVGTECQAAGIDGVLAKPFELEDLARLLREPAE